MPRMPKLRRFSSICRTVGALCAVAGLTACFTLAIPPRVDKTISLKAHPTQQDATKNNESPIRVKDLKVTVAQAGKSLFIYKVRNQMMGGPITSHYGYYWLDRSADAPIRESLSRFVEIDPTATQSLNVEVLVGVRYRIGNDFIGRVFKTTSLVALKTEIKEQDSVLAERVYGEAVQDSFHPSFDIWPTEDEISGPLQEAFEKAIDKMREDLPSLKASL